MAIDKWLARILDITAKIMEDVWGIKRINMMDGVEVRDFCGKWKETENFRGDFPRR
jgi:hypothetical protein